MRSFRWCVYLPRSLLCKAQIKDGRMQFSDDHIEGGRLRVDEIRDETYGFIDRPGSIWSAKRDTGISKAKRRRRETFEFSLYPMRRIDVRVKEVCTRANTHSIFCGTVKICSTYMRFGFGGPGHTRIAGSPRGP